MSAEAGRSCVVVGLGPIGLSIARELGSRLAGGVELRSDAPDLGVPVWRSLAAAAGRAPIAVVTTGSRLPDVAPTIEEALGHGFHVVSTCEELAFPWLGHADLARDLDARARAAGRVVLGTGVNPGFAMDRLVVTAARACVRVDGVEALRVVDLAARRDALRRKIGCGLAEAAWREQDARGLMGHVGLAESAALVAVGLGWPHGEVACTLDPMVEAGFVRGSRQTASAAGGRVRLTLEMALGPAEPRDELRVLGDPPIDLVVRGGIHGDRGTVGAVLDATARVSALSPGLRSVLELTLR